MLPPRSHSISKFCLDTFCHIVRVELGKRASILASPVANARMDSTQSNTVLLPEPLGPNIRLMWDDPGCHSKLTRHLKLSTYIRFNMNISDLLKLQAFCFLLCHSLCQPRFYLIL